jgi:myo-inositol-1(or 4)-monophosphatase
VHTPGNGRPGRRLYGERMDEVRLLDVLDDAVVAVRAALGELEDWGPAGTKPGQYRLDLAADGAALPILHGAGLAVLSEESGLTGDGPAGLLAVIDPVDGSTNAHRGVPFYSTSICVLDAEGPLVGLVVNQALGTRYVATRGGGAERDGRPITPSGCEDLAQAIVGISGFPGRHSGWAQFRALGAASLECCAVAEGVLDAYLVVGRSTLYAWDYLAGLLVCAEAGAVAAERDGRDLVVRDASSRRPIVAATDALATRLSQDESL